MVHDLIFDNNTLKLPAANVDNDSFPQRFNPKVRRWDSLKESLSRFNQKTTDGLQLKME